MTLATLVLFVLAASGAVSQEKTSPTTEISTGDTVVQLMVTEDSLRLASLKCPGDEYSWIPAGPTGEAIPLILSGGSSVGETVPRR